MEPSGVRRAAAPATPSGGLSQPDLRRGQCPARASARPGAPALFPGPHLITEAAGGGAQLEFGVQARGPGPGHEGEEFRAQPAAFVAGSLRPGGQSRRRTGPFSAALQLGGQGQRGLAGWHPVQGRGTAAGRRPARRP